MLLQKVGNVETTDGLRGKSSFCSTFLPGKPYEKKNKTVDLKTMESGSEGKWNVWNVWMFYVTRRNGGEKVFDKICILEITR